MVERFVGKGFVEKDRIYVYYYKIQSKRDPSEGLAPWSEVSYGAIS
jgi:hypothetical protein